MNIDIRTKHRQICIIILIRRYMQINNLPVNSEIKTFLKKIHQLTFMHLQDMPNPWVSDKFHRQNVTVTTLNLIKGQSKLKYQFNKCKINFILIQEESQNQNKWTEAKIATLLNHTKGFCNHPIAELVLIHRQTQMFIILTTLYLSENQEMALTNSKPPIKQHSRAQNI